MHVGQQWALACAPGRGRGPAHRCNSNGWCQVRRVGLGWVGWVGWVGVGWSVRRQSPCVHPKSCSPCIVRLVRRLQHHSLQAHRHQSLRCWCPPAFWGCLLHHSSPALSITCVCVTAILQQCDCRTCLPAASIPGSHAVRRRRQRRPQALRGAQRFWTVHFRPACRETQGGERGCGSPSSHTGMGELAGPWCWAAGALQSLWSACEGLQRRSLQVHCMLVSVTIAVHLPSQLFSSFSQEWGIVSLQQEAMSELQTEAYVGHSQGA